MSTKVNVVLRREKATARTILMYVNDNGRYWWVDAYSKADDHFQVSRDYLYNETEAIRAPSPADTALVRSWATLGKETYDCAIVKRLVGPRGMYYGGE